MSNEQKIVSFSIERVHNGYLYVITIPDGSKELFVYQTANPPTLQEMRNRLVMPEPFVPPAPKEPEEEPLPSFEEEDEEEQPPVPVTVVEKSKKRSTREVDMV